MDYETEVSLGRAMFEHAELGDRRRSMRMASCFDAMRSHPGGSLPDKLAAPADLKALYRLCRAEAVTHEAIISSMRQYTMRRIAETDGPVLVLHDATELDYSSLTSLADDLGQIGKGTHRGYVCQNVIAVDASSGELLGMLDQILHQRDEVPENETLTEHRNRPTRESLLWPKGTAHLPDEARLIDVADQGASTFEFLEHEYKSGRRFVVRNGKTRIIRPGHDESGGETQYIKPYVQGLPELGRFTMDVQAQRGRKARKQAEFALRGGPILLMPPHAKHGLHGDDPLPIYVVYVSETNPPKGEKPIEWMLLTNEPVSTFEDAWRVVGWYEMRWVIEEYHKAKKTGCRIEGLQFTSVDRLQPAIALLSAVALTLLSLRDAARQPDAKTDRATTLFAPEYVEVLSYWRHKKIDLDWTVHDFFFALARLGGHQNRRSDHRPGWLILWRGWEKLQSMLDGYLVAKQINVG